MHKQMISKQQENQNFVFYSTILLWVERARENCVDVRAVQGLRISYVEPIYHDAFLKKVY